MPGSFTAGRFHKVFQGHLRHRLDQYTQIFGTHTPGKLLLFEWEIFGNAIQLYAF